MMQHNFDFDAWTSLAEQDIESFEAERDKLLNQVIEAGYDKRLLNGLQFRINMERRRAKNPMDSCIRISKMMNRQFYDKFFPAFGRADEYCKIDLHRPSKSADIIPFKKDS